VRWLADDLLGVRRELRCELSGDDMVKGNAQLPPAFTLWFSKLQELFVFTAETEVLGLPALLAAWEHPTVAPQ
jgi:hypothetical protein